MSDEMKNALAPVRGILIGLPLGALAWTLIIWGILQWTR